MTERDPDDLYDALRDQLANYGQAPPTQLWAGIRAQLPPPVAQPQLRRRPVLLLSLVLAVAGGISWRWWHAHPLPSTAPSVRIAAFIKRTLGPGSAQQLAATRQAATGVAASAAPTTKPAAQRTGRIILPPPRPGASALASASAPGAEPARATGPFRKQAGLSQASTPSAGHPSKQTRLTGQWAAAKPAGRNPASTIRPDREGPPLNARVEATAKSARFAAGAATSQGTIAPPTAQTAGLGSSLSPESQARTTANSLRRANAIGGARLGRYEAGPAETPLLARLATVPLAAWPAPQPVAIAQSPPPVPLGSRWAVQLLVGPALTYRYLGSAPELANHPSNSIPYTSTKQLSATNVAELERPALGMGAQLGVRRSLGPHWTLSAGLGYAEYANQLTLQVTGPANSNPASADFGYDSMKTTSYHRNTYRFATLPLRMSYVWALSGRWRVGLLAGTEAAVYLGGSSIEGRPCACQNQALSAVGSSYRRFNLGASLGAEVRYRLAERWELLAQPAATYLLTPLARPETAYYPRHLLGGTTLLGVSYELP